MLSNFHSYNYTRNFFLSKLLQNHLENQPSYITNINNITQRAEGEIDDTLLKDEYSITTCGSCGILIFTLF